ncbi:TRAP transporter substrate-binding protein [Scleromatobacter humisilvae]|uniref:TRAP transporter substrate-binding protein n=1 Tax=Scleromatobacter humisilvae TaxID=2897159 RepID=A0A9X2BYH2_9BURK|nr:TRAP transporter substrate-binding protein [Scleromatobacter humisilvae]MCK9685623.1 TRAP transporter substrate-binding protein [Scleromatobacter humisilvae]
MANKIGFDMSGLGFRGRAWLALLGTVAAMAVPVRAADAPALRLHIVGGLASLKPFTQHEKPFWETELPRLSGGRYTAEIVPFDRAGIRAQEALTLVQLGAVPFATIQVSGGIKDPELSAPDLSGLNPDMASMRRSLAAFRPWLEETMRQRYGIEVLAVYVYPAQVLFCNKPLAGLKDVKGLRVRTSGPAQADLIEALGGKAVTTGFNDIVPYLKRDEIDCAVTGTMSGNIVGLPDITTHIHPMAISWGLSMFAANGAAWNALPADLRTLLKRELPRVEREVWDESERDTADGIACNIGAPTCKAGKPGHMKEVPTSPADERLRREIFAATVLPRWLQRCGPQCAAVWNKTMAASAGIRAR